MQTEKPNNDIENKKKAILSFLKKTTDNDFSSNLGINDIDEFKGNGMFSRDEGNFFVVKKEAEVLYYIKIKPLNKIEFVNDIKVDHRYNFLLTQILPFKQPKTHFSNSQYSIYISKNAKFQEGQDLSFQEGEVPHEATHLNRKLIWNVITGNVDCHSKNYKSFLQKKKGKSIEFDYMFVHDSKKNLPDIQNLFTDEKFVTDVMKNYAQTPIMRDNIERFAKKHSSKEYLTYIDYIRTNLDIFERNMNKALKDFKSKGIKIPTYSEQCKAKNKDAILNTNQNIPLNIRENYIIPLKTEQKNQLPKIVTAKPVTDLNSNQSQSRIQNPNNTTQVPILPSITSTKPDTRINYEASKLCKIHAKDTVPVKLPQFPKDSRQVTGKKIDFKS
jgi:hypothetical protein